MKSLQLIWIIQIHNHDNNNDGIPETVNVDISLQILQGAAFKPSDVKSVALISAFDWSLQNTVNAGFKLTTADIYQTPLGFSHIDVIGTLNMNQKAPFENGAI